MFFFNRAECIEPGEFRKRGGGVTTGAALAIATAEPRTCPLLPIIVVATLIANGSQFEQYQPRMEFCTNPLPTDIAELDQTRLRFLNGPVKAREEQTKW